MKSKPNAKRALICVVILISIFLLPILGFAKDQKPDTQEELLKGQEMIFARRYDDALKLFKKLQEDYPNSPSGCFGEMAVYEIQMLEREDMHLEKKLSKVSAEGRKRVGRLLQKYDPSAWDLFISGSLYGLDGFFKARKGQWWDAYVAGNKSRQLFNHVKKIDSGYIDAEFGLGMYIYWRSVFIKDLWFLKMFPDRRAEGIAIVKNVAENGKFAKEMAKINLGLMYFEEKRYADASKIFKSYVNRFPDNVVVRRLYGKVLVAQKKYDDALNQFQAMLRIDPSLKKPHYFIGATLVIEGNPKNFLRARRELTLFIEEQEGTYWPASSHYWLGRLFEKEGKKTEAKKEYEKAYKMNSDIKDALKRARGMGSGL